jgi:3-deoxy-D-manno-octulosonate 8-phosphate phosphatase (KDO 8-P phosphatase)
MANGIELASSRRIGHMVTERTAELGIAHVYRSDDKLACYEQLIHALELARTDPLLRRRPARLARHEPRRLAIAVAAHAWVRERAHWRTRQPGGDSAVREVAIC